MIHIGKIQRLKVDHEDTSGYYLLCEDNGEAFLPGTLSPDGLKVGDEIDVFVYIDKNGDEIATSQLPKASVGEFACLKVKDVSAKGAFLDLGLPKDLLVPRSMQKYEMNVGDIHLVKILQEENGRLYGTSKIGSYIENENIELKIGETIELVPYFKTPLGFKVLINNKYLGLIYHSEIFTDIEFGEPLEGTVKLVRNDGQVDAILGKTGVSAISEDAQTILDTLKSSGGKLNLWDKSSPEDIKSKLSMSKSAFKKAVGSLYKDRRIEIQNGSIELKKS